jgi:formiminotetrahydrofolate cyclodeaminase
VVKNPGVNQREDMLGAPLENFLAALARDGVAPGGGSAAAVSVAMAAALTRSVAQLSRDCWAESGGAVAQAEALAERVRPLAELDAHAYDEALSALAERGTTAEEERDSRLSEALDRAAELPLQIGEVGADVAELAAVVAEQGDDAARADATAAAILAEAGARAAAELVEVNLATLPEDPRIERSHGALNRASEARERAAARPG